MKERPILFNGTMIRARQEGRKTQTRRTCKFDWSGSLEKLMHQSTFDPAYKCPYGIVGDRLWVKETWRTSQWCDNKAPSELEIPGGGYGWPVWYEADGSINLRGRKELSGGPGFTTKGKIRQSIFMPRWAYRTMLEIISVRPERLNDISEEDAKAEGVEECGGFMTASGCWKNYGSDGPSFWSPALSYRSLWESINGPGSWDLNPLVWVIEFMEVNP